MTEARAPRHHVLLIGIDAYQHVSALHGCVNDIDQIERICVEKAGIPAEHVTRLAAPRAGGGDGARAPTLANVRAALAALGTDAVRAGDRVFIYYAGHGTQCDVGVRGRRYQREALVPCDGVMGTKPRELLFDWELNALLTAIAERTSSVTVVLDCCSAAGATRGRGDPPADSERFLPPVPGAVFAVDELPAPRSTRDGPPPPPVPGITRLLRGIDGCQVVAACRDTERARESSRGERAHGELTRALVRHLDALPVEELPAVRWSRIWRAVEQDVTGANARQHPWMYGSYGRRIFGLGDDDALDDPGIALHQEGPVIRLEAGTFAGVTAGATLAVYGEQTKTFAPVDSPDDRAARIATLRVQSAERTSAVAAVQAAARLPLPHGARARLVTPGAPARLRVYVSPPEAEAELLQAARDLVELTGVVAAEVYLTRDAAGAWALLDNLPALAATGEDPRPVVVVPASHRAKLRAIVEHYRAYSQPTRMALLCRDLPSLLRITVLACDRTLAADEAQDLPLDPAPAGGGLPYSVAAGRAVCVEVENASLKALSVTLIDSAASGAVSILGATLVQPRSRQRFWDLGVIGKPFPASLPPGVTDSADRLVAIGTTRHGHDLRYLARRLTWHEILYGRGSMPRSSGQEPELWTSDITALHIHA